MTNEVNLVLIGADGQLGRALQELLPRGTTFKEATHYWVHPFAHHARRFRHNWAPALDVSDRAATLKAVTSAIEREAAREKFRSTPNIVINAAAWTDTAACERDPERAMLVNCEGARNVAEAAREAGAAMLHISTNEVFDGEKHTPYAEDDSMNAINAYGRSKQAGEQAVRKALPQHYIVRTSWLYGPGRNSFPEKILQAANDKKQLRVVTDEVGSPTFTSELAVSIIALIETQAYGTYHLTNSGECSRYDWAAEVLRLADVNVPIEPTTLAEFAAAVRKPPYSALANNNAARLGITLRPWRDALRDHMRATAGVRA